MSKSIKSQEKQISEIDKLKQLNKEKSEFDFKDQKKIDDFLKRQMQKEEMMQSYSEKLKKNLEEFNPEDKDKQKELLEERLEKNKQESEKNKQLLEELKKLTDKIKKEELFDKIEKFQQKAKAQQKSLEQLVELTKRFYVEKKLEKITDDLDKLSKKQDKLAEQTKDKNTAEKQEELNTSFEELQKELQELKKENDELKNPMDLPMDKKEQEQVKDDMQKAKEDLKKDKQDQAKPKQKAAAQKMKQMSQKMKASSMQMKGQQLQEDAKMLRQILDNLLAFSFLQEDLMLDFKNLNRKSPAFSKNLKGQHNLKMQFKHIDDSLFALSMRNPMIGENINKQVGEIHYNVDKSIEQLADANLMKGISHQQYTITAANTLAEFLSNVQDDMQMQMQGMGSGGQGMPSPGEGEGEGQLPDIIKKQEDLMKKMKEGIEKGEGEKGEKGEKPGGESGSGEGSSGQQGENGQDGEGDAEQIYEIYKEQQMLREALSKQLQKQGKSGIGQNANRQMQDIEKQLLNKRFDNTVLQKMQNLKHELLKLDSAIKQQGDDDKREATTNLKEFNTSAKPLDSKLQEYLNSIEILNRDALPLQPVYNQKVQQYFKKL